MEENTSTIKKANAPSEIITKEEYDFRIREIAKCKKDIVYFANTYFKILNLNTGITTIKLYPKQEELLKFFKDEKRCIVKAARQSSKTTTYTIFLLWSTIFFPERKAMILANKAATAIEIVSRIQLGYEYLPVWLKPAVVTWNKGQILFANKSEIRGWASSSDAARGFSAQLVCLDEFAFLPKNIADRLFTSIYPVVSTAKESKIIIVSTPNGTVDNLYYELWTEANSPSSKNKEGWKPFEMNWWDVPGRDEHFKEMTIASIGQKRWDQEFACEFLSPSDFRKLIPEDILEKYKMRLDQYKLQNDFFGRDMQILSEDSEKAFTFTMWECFKPNRAYLASGDIAEGTGQDQSVLYIWDVTDLGKIELVCKFANNEVSVLEFAYICREILKLYANPPFVAENNACGAGLLDALRLTYKYQNIVKEGTPQNRYGIRSHISTKSKGCLWLRDMCTTMGFDWVIRDRDLLKEASSFVRRENKTGFATYAAMGNTHDDLMLSWIWCAYILQPNIVEKYFVAVAYFTSSLGVVYPKTLVAGIDYTEDELKDVFNSDYYKEFQESVVRERVKQKQSDEKKLELAKKERELLALERRISETDYTLKRNDTPFNPIVTKESALGGEERDGSSGGGGSRRPQFVFDGDGMWSDADFEGGVW